MESFNGIMLCKRPPPGSIPMKHDRSAVKINSSHRSFNSKLISSSHKKSNTKDGSLYWKPCGGSTRIVPEKAKVVSRITKNDDALKRHKQWLKQIQIKKEEQIKEKEEEARLKEEKKLDFMERQAKRRAMAREIECQSSSEDSSCSDKENNGNHTNEDVDGTMEHHVNAGGKRSRPAWSLAETKAETMQAKEENELLEFVEDLNLQSFYDDMELKILMSQVKNRISILEKEKNMDESRLKVVMNVSVLIGFIPYFARCN